MGRQIKTPEVAAILGVAESTVHDWRKSLKGPPFYRKGGWHVFYDEDEVQAYRVAREAVERVETTRTAGAAR